MLGQRLKLARSAAGLSLRGLEERIGNRVTAQAIGKYERDESMPSSGVLIALADALSVSVDYLVGDQEMALESLEFRKKSLTSKREEMQVEAKILHLLERYLMVEEFLGLPRSRLGQASRSPLSRRQRSLGGRSRRSQSPLILGSRARPYPQT